MNKLLRYLATHPKSIYLIDGAGALLTAIMLGLVLPRFERLLGIPTSVLHTLAFIPLFIIVYDIYCYRSSHHQDRHLLRIVALVNIIYCVISVSLAIYHRDAVTTWGYLYIGGEILVILVLVLIELQLAREVTDAT